MIDELMALLLLPSDRELRTPHPSFKRSALNRLVREGWMIREGDRYAWTDVGLAEQAMLFHEVDMDPE